MPVSGCTGICLQLIDLVLHFRAQRAVFPAESTKFPVQREKPGIPLGGNAHLPDSARPTLEGRACAGELESAGVSLRLQPAHHDAVELLRALDIGEMAGVSGFSS